MPPANTEEKKLWDRAFVDWWWLERFGLTPNQVRDLPLNTQDRVPLIAALADQVSEEKMKRS